MVASLMSTDVKIRKVMQRDLAALQAIFADSAMGLPSEDDYMQGVVAVDENDKPLGFIRIYTVLDKSYPEGNGHYVYPVIVAKDLHGEGIGRILIEYAHEKYGELKLVACRASRDFYPKCGFVPLSWEFVAHKIAYDCEMCPDIDSCEPQAFMLH